MDNESSVNDLTQKFVAESNQILEDIGAHRRSTVCRRQGYTPDHLKQKIMYLNRVWELLYGVGFVTPEEKSAYLAEKKRL